MIAVGKVQIRTPSISISMRALLEDADAAKADEADEVAYSSEDAE